MFFPTYHQQMDTRDGGQSVEITRLRDYLADAVLNDNDKMWSNWSSKFVHKVRNYVFIPEQTRFNRRNGSLEFLPYVHLLGHGSGGWWQKDEVEETFSVKWIPVWLKTTDSLTFAIYSFKG